MDSTLQHASTTCPEMLVWEDPLAAPALKLPPLPPPEFPVLSPFANNRAPLTSCERRLRAISLTFQFLENKQPTSSIPNTCIEQIQCDEKLVNLWYIKNYFWWLEKNQSLLKSLLYLTDCQNCAMKTLIIYTHSCVGAWVHMTCEHTVEEINLR